MIRKYAMVLALVPILTFAKPPKVSPLNTIINPPSIVAQMGQSNTLTVNFDWTHCGFNLINDSSFVANLNGSYNAGIPLRWCLTTISTTGAVIPDICLIGYVADQYGQPGNVPGIPVTWEIAIDGGSFIILTQDSFCSMSTMLPVGQHSFTVRMTGRPLPFQAAGHYYIELFQSFSQQL
jgi:hypothetical protein